MMSTSQHQGASHGSWTWRRAGGRRSRQPGREDSALRVHCDDQIWTVWVDGQVAGVSLLSWGTYLLGACLWFIHGWARRDKTIYVACIGWILLNGAVVLGVLVQG
jgi:hypothetical protein